MKYLVERNGEYYSECNGWTCDKSKADHFDIEIEAQEIADDLTMSWGTRHTVVKYRGYEND